VISLSVQKLVLDLSDLAIKITDAVRVEPVDWGTYRHSRTELAASYDSRSEQSPRAQFVSVGAPASRKLLMFRPGCLRTTGQEAIDMNRWIQSPCYWWTGGVKVRIYDEMGATRFIDPNYARRGETAMGYHDVELVVNLTNSKSFDRMFLVASTGRSASIRTSHWRWGVNAGDTGIISSTSVG
jgi:hypothetical protein